MGEGLVADAEEERHHNRERLVDGLQLGSVVAAVAHADEDVLTEEIRLPPQGLEGWSLSARAQDQGSGPRSGALKATASLRSERTEAFGQICMPFLKPVFKPFAKKLRVVLDTLLFVLDIVLDTLAMCVSCEAALQCENVAMNCDGLRSIRCVVLP